MSQSSDAPVLPKANTFKFNDALRSNPSTSGPQLPSLPLPSAAMPLVKQLWQKEAAEVDDDIRFIQSSPTSPQLYHISELNIEESFPFTSE